MEPVKVLIVDDSKTLSQFLEFVLKQDPEIEIIGKCENGKQAVEFVQQQKPDLITMDIDMPVMNGLEATRQIMSSNPVPIIVVTASRNAKDSHISMEALAAGALTVLEKPLGFSHPDSEARLNRITKLVKIYSQVKVIRRRYSKQEVFQKPVQTANTLISSKIPKPNELSDKKILAIGVSTGGPEVLKQIIPVLSKDFPIPVLIVQHITAGFLEGMVSWLNSLSGISIKVAENKETMQPGNVYFAPDKHQMGVFGNQIVLKPCNEGTFICPSVSFLFQSLAVKSNKAIAMLLTGMGNDGAKELKLIKDSGGLTIAQDKESSRIYGMPGEAVKLGAASYVLNINQISAVLNEIQKNVSR